MASNVTSSPWIYLLSYNNDLSEGLRLLTGDDGSWARLLIASPQALAAGQVALDDTRHAFHTWVEHLGDIAYEQHQSDELMRSFAIWFPSPVGEED
jgi:hypothetical protein